VRRPLAMAEGGGHQVREDCTLFLIDHLRRAKREIDAMNKSPKKDDCDSVSAIVSSGT
jgi:hypothetical protein